LLLIKKAAHEHFFSKKTLNWIQIRRNLFKRYFRLPKSLEREKRKKARRIDELSKKRKKKVRD
jgi:hypothetical protein